VKSQVRPHRAAPGADPNIIRFGLEGVKTARIDRRGDLILRTASGDLRQSKPVVYQETGEEKRNRGLPLSVDDALTEVLRRGAKELLQQAVEVEVAKAIAQYAELKDEQGGRRMVVRNGYLLEHSIQTGIGEVAVRAPRVRD
jgi:hypothetical protein